jgi:hypothetical protein
MHTLECQVYDRFEPLYGRFLQDCDECLDYTPAIEVNGEPIELEEEITPETEPIKPEQFKNIVILSVEKYDQMKADYEQCIEERDRELWKMDRELRSLQALVKALGITPDIAKNVYPDSVEVMSDVNPINYTTKYIIKFDVRR